MTAQWHRIASVDEIEEDDVIGVEVEGRTIAIYNVGGQFFASEGICTHEYACLADGLVIGGVIECPLHQGRFDIRTGKAKSAPASTDLRTYPVKVEGSAIHIQMDD